MNSWLNAINMFKQNNIIVALKHPSFILRDESIYFYYTSDSEKKNFVNNNYLGIISRENDYLQEDNIIFTFQTVSKNYDLLKNKIIQILKLNNIKSYINDIPISCLPYTQKIILKTGNIVIENKKK